MGKCQVGRLEAEGLYGAGEDGYWLEPEENQTVEGGDGDIVWRHVDVVVDVGVGRGFPVTARCDCDVCWDGNAVAVTTDQRER